jgi:hypothetical protein
MSDFGLDFGCGLERASDIPLLKEEGWMRHQSLEQPQTEWSLG